MNPLSTSQAAISKTIFSDLFYVENETPEAFCLRVALVAKQKINQINTSTTQDLLKVVEYWSELAINCSNQTPQYRLRIDLVGLISRSLRRGN